MAEICPHEVNIEWDLILRRRAPLLDSGGSIFEAQSRHAR